MTDAATADRDWLADRRAAAASCLAEALGTFALVFVGAGALAVDAASEGAVTGVGVGLAFGFIVMALVLALGHVSGCHINPAVTLAFRVTRRIGNRRALAYVVAQLAGGILGGLAIVAVVGGDGDAGATAPRIGGTDAALLSELILTFFLALVVFGAATDARAEGGAAGLAIGAYVGLAALSWGPVANASMNPARSLGPAIAGNEWSAHWVYWLGPIAGAVLGALAYELMRPPARKRDASGEPRDHTGDSS